MYKNLRATFESNSDRSHTNVRSLINSNRSKCDFSRQLFLPGRSISKRPQRKHVYVLAHFEYFAPIVESFLCVTPLAIFASGRRNGWRAHIAHVLKLSRECNADAGAYRMREWNGVLWRGAHTFGSAIELIFIVSILSALYAKRRLFYIEHSPNMRSVSPNK